MDLTRSIEQVGSTTGAEPTSRRQVVKPLSGRVIIALEFDPQGVSVDYLTADGLRANGVRLTQRLRVPHGDQYDDEIDAVVDAVNALLEDVLEDLPRMRPAITEHQPDEDDE